MFGFEYINRADVEVYVGEPGNWTQFTEGNAGTANQYQWQNDTTIRLNAPAGNDNVLITRETDRCDPVAEYFPGSSITADDLNNQEQALFLAQEAMATLRAIGADQPPGTDGITLDDLEGVDILNAVDRNWLFFNGTGWVNGPVVMSTFFNDAWASADDRIATAPAALDGRFSQSITAAGNAIGFDQPPGMERR